MIVFFSFLYNPKNKGLAAIIFNPLYFGPWLLYSTDLMLSEIDCEMN